MESWVGLRPGRPAVRLEKDVMKFQDTEGNEKTVNVSVSLIRRLYLDCYWIRKVQFIPNIAPDEVMEDLLCFHSNDTSSRAIGKIRQADFFFVCKLDF